MSGLPHPIIQKAKESFGDNPNDRIQARPIASSTQIRLLEIRQGQWRGGVWEDKDTGIHWLVVAGLAKGNHQDRDDFYEVVARTNQQGNIPTWLPQPSDINLLKLETAARLRTQWELDIQTKVFQSLERVHSGGSQRVEFLHPIQDRGPMCAMNLTVSLERAIDLDGTIDADVINVEFFPRPEYESSSLFWSLILRVLISLEPPQEKWERFKNSFSNLGEPGAWKARIKDLENLTNQGLLAKSKPCSHSHYTHRRHLAENTINGKAVRSLCGSYFVPIQDHTALPTCPECQQIYEGISRQS